MSDLTLQVSGLTKSYNVGKPNQVNVLQGASLDVAAGEVVALVAPSGAGKSTLLHIAGLLDTPDAGTVQIAGEDMTNLSDRRRTAVRRATVGFIYQFHHLQRVAFCRALANEPKLLLADEPTGNLDPDTSERVFDTLMSLVRDTGLAAVIATHNLELAARMDRQVRLTAGVLEPL